MGSTDEHLIERLRQGQTDTRDAPYSRYAKMNPCQKVHLHLESSTGKMGLQRRASSSRQLRPWRRGAWC